MSDDIKPLQSEVKIVDNASQAFDAIKESILGASKAFDHFIESMNTFQNLKLAPLELKANVQPIVVPAPPPPTPEPVQPNIFDQFKDTSSAFDRIYDSLRKNQREGKETSSVFDRFKKSLNAVGKGSANATMSLKSIGEAYRGLQGIAASARAVGQILKMSDESARFRARLGNLTEEQRGAAFAGKADGSGYSVGEIDKSMLNVANTMGIKKGEFAEQTMTFLTGTGGAFGNIGEAAKFSELLTKRFMASGVSAASAAGAIEQIRQGLSKGALQGQDLKSVLSHAPQIAELFAQKLGVSVGEIGELASQGKITADVVKGAMFDNAEAIEAAFNKMPMTWESVANRLQNTFLDMADPILQKIGELTSTDMFNDLLQGLMSMVDIAFTLVDVLFTGFEAIRPIIEPVISAFAFMANAIQNNIQLVGILAGTMLGIGIAYKIITNWQKISIALNKLIAATNPFLAFVAIIMGAVLALKHLWDTSMDFQFAVKEGWNSIKYGFSVGFSYIKQAFQAVIGAIIRGFGFFLDKIQGGLNDLIEVYNFFATDKIEAFSFADDINAFANEMMDPKKHALERERLRAEKENQSILLAQEKAEAIAQAERNAKSKEPVELAYGQTGTKPLHTKGTTKIDKDSIQLLKDIASVELVNRYTTIQPRVRVNVGTINHEADVDNFFDRFATEVENANASSLSEVYA